MHTVQTERELVLFLPPTARSLLGRIVGYDTPAGQEKTRYREDVLALYGVTLRREITDPAERAALIDDVWAALPWQEKDGETS